MKTIQKEKIVMFEQEQVRRIWSDKSERWYFSVVDVVRVLTRSPRPRKYWNALKAKLKQEGSELSQKVGQLKMLANDGKYYNTDIADVEALLRLIQSIPSPKAEPFKLWLAKVGYERLKETTDPEIAINRARKNWLAMGRSKQWIDQRMRGIELRNKLTDYWATHEISVQEQFARLTNIIHREWSGVTVKRHKQIKRLKGHNLRDHMTDAELIFTSLAELSTRKVAEKDNAAGYGPNASAAQKGGALAGRAKKDFEKITGSKVVSKENYLPPNKTKFIGKSR